MYKTLWQFVNAAMIGVVATFAQAQTCNERATLSTATERFTDHFDGTVTDNATGLRWSKCALGISGASCGVGTAQNYTWSEALVAAETSGLSGFSDWRLPNIKELNSIVETACYSPSINAAVFPETPDNSWFWSSSPSAFNGRTANQAWSKNFYNGNDNAHLKANGFNVRLVRDSQ